MSHNLMKLLHIPHLEKGTPVFVPMITRFDQCGSDSPFFAESFRIAGRRTHAILPTANTQYARNAISGQT